MAVPYSRTIIGSLPWYSVLIVSGIVAALWLACMEERRLGLPADTVVDAALIAVPLGIVGARLYYVLMSWEQFAPNPISVLYVWQGGIGIYGGILGGLLGVWLYTRKKKLSFARLTDVIVPGLLLAQAIGRWGNYFNMEAYGVELTDARLQFFPLAVWIPAKGAWHAATFFYESIWNAAGCAALWGMRKKSRRDGWLTAWYLVIYGSGRFVIEQLRTDSLYIGAFRASQWLSLVLCIIACVFLLCVSLKRGQQLAAFGCVFLWISRWAVLNAHGVYAMLMVLAGVIALWLCRYQRKALLWLLAAIVLDGFGLAAALGAVPVEGLAQGMHAALCSLTLPAGLWAVCGNQYE